MSLLLFNNRDFSNNMWYFSARQRSHFLAAGEHGFVLSRMVHSVLWITPASFSVHRCSLRVVVDLLWGSLKLELWRLYLVLKGFSVIPMYMSCFLPRSPT